MIFLKWMAQYSLYIRERVCASIMNEFLSYSIKNTLCLVPWDLMNKRIEIVDIRERMETQSKNSTNVNENVSYMPTLRKLQN